MLSSKTVKMEAINLHIEMRCVIKFLVKRNKKAIQIYEELQSVYQEYCLSRESVYYWFRQFKTFASENVADAPGRGRPITARTDEKVQAVRHIIENYTAIGQRNRLRFGNFSTSGTRHHSP